MNWLQKVFCGGCPETKEVVVEKIVEVEVKVSFDDKKYEDAAKELQTAYARAVKAEAKCKELGMSVSYLELEPIPPSPPETFYGRHYFLGALSKYSVNISNVIRKDFNEPKSV